MTGRLEWSGKTSMMTWGGEIVVYHHQTGDTHLFAGLPARVVKLCLSKKTFGIVDLLNELRDFCRDIEYFAQEIELIIADLKRKHLILASCS